MPDDTPQDTVWELIRRRRIVVVDQISDLKAQLTAREAELTAIDRMGSQEAVTGVMSTTEGADAFHAVGGAVLVQADFAGIGVPSRNLIAEGATFTITANPLLSPSPKDLTIKELVMRALMNHFLERGASAPELAGFIENAYRRTVDLGTLRPQLARLKDEGAIEKDHLGNWLLSHASVLKLFPRLTDDEIVERLPGLAKVRFAKATGKNKTGA